jgi:low temperature requirement protein LtrA
MRNAYLRQDMGGTLVRLVATAAVTAVVFSALSMITPGLAEPHRMGIAWGIALAVVVLPVERFRGQAAGDGE